MGQLRDFFINHFITSKPHRRLQPNLVTGYLCLSILCAVIYKSKSIQPLRIYETKNAVMSKKCVGVTS